jgi:hypothetical protein
MIEEGLLIDEACYAQAVCKFKLGLRAESSEYVARVLQLDQTNEKAQQLQDILESTASKGNLGEDCLAWYDLSR